MVQFFSCLFIFLGLSLTVNAGRPTLQAAKQTIPKLECRLYQECSFELKLKELINTYKTSVNSSDTKIFRFVSQQLNETRPSERLEKLDIHVIPVQVGRAILKAIAQNGTEVELAQVVIIRPNRGIDIAFDVFLWIYVGLVSFAMGAAIHRDLIRDFLTGNRQKEVSVSFFCQYFIMPILAYGVTRVFAIKPMQSLALFIYVMMPAWLYTLGGGLMEAAGIRLSLAGLALNMSVLIGPAVLGFLLSWLIPDLRLFANIANKIIHSMIFIAIFLVLIFTSRLYAFKLGNPLFILVGPMIAFLGYIIGAIVAWIFGFPADKIKSVSLDTGFQNIMFAFLVVNWNIPSPEIDYILVCLVPVFLQTSLPIKIIFLVQKIKGCVTRRRDKRNKPSTVEINADKIEQEPMYSERA